MIGETGSGPVVREARARPGRRDVDARADERAGERLLAAVRRRRSENHPTGDF